VRFMELGKVTIAAGEVSEPETVLVNAEHILKVRSGPQHYNTSNVTLLDGKSLDVNEPFEQLKRGLNTSKSLNKASCAMICARWKAYQTTHCCKCC